MRSAPYGAWQSPVSAAMAAAAGVRLSEPWLGTGGSIWWLERRPSNGGHTTLVRDGEDVTAPEINVRTRVHEYGGGAWLLHDDTAFFSEYSDQRLYRLDPGSAPRPITPEPPKPSSIRYADGRATPDGELIVCVRETHGDGEPVNDLVAVPADGSSEPRVLSSGRDFYAYPRPSPDGTQVCWSAGTTPTCRGTAPSCGWLRSTTRRLRAKLPAARASPSGSPPGARRPAPLGVRPRRLVEHLPGGRAGHGRARPSSAIRSGCSAARRTTSCPTVRSCACACRARWSASACSIPASRSWRISASPTTPLATPT